jgi:hypothetical protein
MIVLKELRVDNLERGVVRLLLGIDPSLRWFQGCSADRWPSKPGVIFSGGNMWSFISRCRPQARTDCVSDLLRAGSYCYVDDTIRRFEADPVAGGRRLVHFELTRPVRSHSGLLHELKEQRLQPASVGDLLLAASRDGTLGRFFAVVCIRSIWWHFGVFPFVPWLRSCAKGRVLDVLPLSASWERSRYVRYLCISLDGEN